FTAFPFGCLHRGRPKRVLAARNCHEAARPRAHGQVGEERVRMFRWLGSLNEGAAEALDRRVGWDKLPLPVAMLVLIGLRNVLRRKNLYDSGRGPLDRPDVSEHPRYLTARTLDGTFNSLDDPLMGS